MTSTEEKLARVERELEELKAEYYDFSYILSHDLSSPVRTISGFSAIIAKDHSNDFDEKTKKHLEHVIKGADEAKEILATLLEYSRINTQPEPFIECDCNEIVAKVTKELASLIEISGAQIQDSTLPIILADKDQIYQLFYHLLHNALLYQHDGITPNIQLSCKDKGDNWEFLVKDNGIGIKESMIEKIFKPLRRAVSNKYYPDRAGMGLAISKKILQRHQGRIWLESTPNAGSIFYFTIGKGLKND